MDGNLESRARVKMKENLDETDIEILLALQKQTEKVGTPQLSGELDISERTLRYRIDRLRKKGILCPPKIQTYERKLGIGENLLLLQSNPEKEEKLISVLDKTEAFYYYAATNGRYDGFMVYAMYPLVAPRVNHQVAEEMKEAGLINDFYVVDMVDYCRKGPSVEDIKPESKWSWETWSKEIAGIMEDGCELDLGLEEFPSAAKFDIMDIRIIKYMVENPETTFAEMSDKVDGLSVTQAHKRVKRLEKLNIIRGMKRTFNPFEETISIACFFKSRSHAKKILCGFHKLPFEMNIAMETSAHYVVTVNMPPSETNQFLQRSNYLRKFTEEFFIQVVMKGKGKGYSHLLEAYNQKTESWEIPISQVLETIRTVSE
ncbi:MAG: winged helix-turn-helix transcriptional regulator [Candidatus Thorarchaeota archaeon]|nr:winged helix-turn-helix transcriptional regulator [Candidatus Thorarchaeota archaeon]